KGRHFNQRTMGLDGHGLAYRQVVGTLLLEDGFPVDQDLHASRRELPAQLVPAARFQRLLHACGQAADRLATGRVRTVDAQLAGLPFAVEKEHAAAAGPEAEIVPRHRCGDDHLDGTAIPPSCGGGLAWIEAEVLLRIPAVAEDQVPPGLVQERIL